MGVATTYNPGSKAAFAMSRFNALLLLFVLAVVSPAFSADPPTGTTGFGPPPADSRDDIDPATGLARTTVVKPLGDAPAVPDPKRAPAQAKRAHVALILPTGSATLGRLAEAVRQGFAAAAEVQGRDSPPVVATAIENEGTALLDACRAAQAAGAVLIVGGMTRDGATSLAVSDCPRQPTLALNELQGAVSAPETLYSFTLSLENEARQVALLAVADGMKSVVLIGSPSPLSRRVLEAFEREWSRAAGQVAGRLTFSGTAEDAPLVRERLANVRADMVFIALDQPEARAVRPYITAMLPVYATSMSINPRAETIVNVDLQGVRYVDMPWFVQPDHPAVMVYPQPRSPMSVEEERLYAFGIDAFRLATQMLRSDRKWPLDGVTGKITLEAGNFFARTPTAAEIDGGRVIPLRAP
jgi:outer membrane PBP1 activator LpoA protein